MQTNEIKISVMIPVYNTSQYLEKCLESITTQSLKEIEIICVNDGSTDNSLEILRKYEKKDNRIKIIDKKNEGANKARNEALKLAKGEYCLNIDSDDLIKQDYLKNMYNKAKKEDLDILISDIIYFFPNKEYVEKDLKLDDNKIIDGKEYIKLFFKENFLGYTWNKLIKSKIYKENNLKYNENIFLFDDVELMLRLSYFCKRIGKLNEAFYCYRQGENNGVRKIKLKNLKDLITCFDSLIDFYKNKEEWILKELIQIKKLFYTSEVLSEKYKFMSEYEEVLKDYFKYLKNEDFIINGFTSKNKRLFGRKERSFICICFNSLKLFPNKKILNYLICIKKILKRG